MRKVFASPARYIQGKDELAHLADHAKTLGKKPLILISEGGMKRSAPMVESSFKKENLPYKIVAFGGEASKQEVSKLRKECAEEKCDMFIGIGGGKILDSVKAAAYYENVPVIVCPTVAASDAPCSALTVLYTPEGEFEEYLFLPHNPNIVLVDEAGLRRGVEFLSEGIGGQLREQIGHGGLRNKRAGLAETAVGQCLPDFRRAHDTAVFLQSPDDFHVHTLS